jgi:autotransporter family porin
LGDCRGATQAETKGCASLGIMQVKGANIPATYPGTWPAAMTSTAFNVDFALAVRRLCYDGKETWMRQFNSTYAAGDLWGCIGRWYSGNWRDSAAITYIQKVQAILSARPWRSTPF